MTPRRFTSMAQQRRFERQQNEIEKLRQAKAANQAKNMDGKAESTDDGTSGNEEGSNPTAAETKSEE